MIRLTVASIAVVVLAGCGSRPVAVPAAPGALPDRSATSVALRLIPNRPDRRRSWISPALARAKSSVLYVSDPGTSDVYAYNVPSLEMIGTITGFSQPQGECSDAKGNVWITDANAKTIYELSHHGHLENELADTAGYPDACAWDPTTGNLAVMNIFGIGSTAGSVLIYAHGSQSAPYVNPDQYFYNFGGYDSAGNLFFDGRAADGTFVLSELPKGADTAHTLKVTGGVIYFPGMVEWDALKHYLVVGDQSCGNVYSSCVYAVKIGQKSATIARRTDLRDSGGGAVCDLVQGTLFNKQIAGSDDAFCGSTASATYLWPYPGGGAPTRHVENSDSMPVGATISR